VLKYRQPLKRRATSPGNLERAPTNLGKQTGTCHNTCNYRRIFFTGPRRLTVARDDERALLARRLLAVAPRRDEALLRDELRALLRDRADVDRDALARVCLPLTLRLEALPRVPLLRHDAETRRDLELPPRRAAERRASARPRLTLHGERDTRYTGVGSGFQPVATSARNSGSLSKSTRTSGEVTAHADASARSARTSEMTRSGRRARDS
jgi:hypothetical protein